MKRFVKNPIALPLFAVMCAAVLCPFAMRAQIGAFAKDGDIGAVLHPGSASFDTATRAYRVTGSGENMWFGTDAFHFVWTQMHGDVALSADISFIGTSGNEHRKAALLIRQTLEPGAKYVDVARHGNGLTSLQYRDAAGADTHEVESNVSAPKRVRIEKRGSYAYVFVSGANGTLEPSGAAMRVDFSGDFYVGLGVCSHDKDVTETAVFSNVELETLTPGSTKPVLYSALETVTIASTDRRVAYVAPQHFEAPNWSRDGTSLLFNQDGTMRRLALDSSTPTVIASGSQVHCNNDHGLSPDGSLLAISDQTAADGNSRIYTLPATGGTPRQVTPTGPSYWHGWSPDGKTLAFTGLRSGEFDIYTVPAAGGKEVRLTTAKGLDDGPEYTPDGASIYFNSERTGSMQIWRMNADGSGQEQVIADSSNDWFPHISPDGKWMVFLAYDKSVNGHPANQDVELRLMSMADKKVRVLAKLFGGQGTINVPSWSPDSTKLAFVSYTLLPQ
jgi:TolB protein